MPDYLLLPAKDEEANLPWILERAHQVGLLAVVCDDGSSDRTAQVAKAHGARVLRHRENLGLGAALKTLFTFALAEGRRGDLFLVMDADATMDPLLFPQMAHTLYAKDADLVIASRFRGGGVEGLSPFRRFLSAGARLYFSLLFPGLGVTDWTTGWRLYRYEWLERYAHAHPFLFHSRGFTAQTEMLLRAAQMVPRPRVVEVGVTLAYGRKGGRSKMRVVRTAWGGRRPWAFSSWGWCFTGGGR